MAVIVAFTVWWCCPCSVRVYEHGGQPDRRIIRSHRVSHVIGWVALIADAALGAALRSLAAVVASRTPRVTRF